MAVGLRVRLRVRPGASRTEVGGSYAGALVVRVTSPAVEGRATDAVLRAVAAAFDVRPRAVTLVSGATSRTKVVDVEMDAAAGQARLTELLDRAAPSG